MCKIEATAILPQFKLGVFERIRSSRIFIRHYKRSLQIYQNVPQLQNKKIDLDQTQNKEKRYARTTRKFRYSVEYKRQQFYIYMDTYLVIKSAFPFQNF